MLKTMNRRSFIIGSAAGALGVTGASFLGGCSPTNTQGEDANENSGSNAATPDETISADIVVVGGGMSGLAAAVQAAQLEKTVVLLECTGILGGNGAGTEGIFAVNSHMQQEQGIEITLAEVVAHEQEFFNYKVNALLWKDLVEASGENISWLEENGVRFSGVVDDYPPMGAIPAFHWWADHSAQSYIEPMGAKAEELGVDIRLNTRGRSLIINNGAVAGILAETADGSLLQIDTKAVILASGGYAGNMEKLASLGINTDMVNYLGMEGHNGDGLEMAVQAGAMDISLNASYLRETTVAGSTPADPACQFLMTNSTPIWVNQDAERFVNEDCLSVTSGCVSNACSNQEAIFGIFGQSTIADDTTGVAENLQTLIDGGNGDIHIADTVQELAEALGVDTEALQTTLDRYNAFCSSGTDEDFAKPANKLISIEAPYYGLRLSYAYMCSIGGIRSNRNAEILDPQGKPIPGLYAAGADGCQLYGGTYTITMPGSFNGNNIYSGRNAAKHAAAFIEA